MSKEEQAVGTGEVSKPTPERKDVEGEKIPPAGARKEAEKKLNPSAPGETGTTPGSNSK